MSVSTVALSRGKMLNKVNVCNMDTLREFLSWGVVSVSIPDIYGYVVRKT